MQLKTSTALDNKSYFRAKELLIYNDDILTTTTVENDSIDLIITSPPYNVNIKYNSHYDEMPYKDYLDFTREWLSKCYDLTKDDGRFCLNIPLDKNKAGNKVFALT